MSAKERAAQSLAIDAVIDLEKRRRMLGIDELAEVEHQFQIPVSGAATDVLIWETARLIFDVEFFYAPEQRDSPLTMPQFTYGAVIAGRPNEAEVSNTLGAVEVTAVVLEWDIDEERNATVGATVAIGVRAESDLSIPFSGTVHATFQGFGALAENQAALDVGT